MLSLKRRFSAFIIASGCLLCSCVSQQKAAPVDLIDATQIKTASVKYRLASPEITDLVVTVTANGYAFLPVKERLYFKEAGPSVAILVRNNTFVSKGEVLAELTFDREEVLTNIELTQIYIDKENADHAAVNRNFDNNIAALRKQMWAETDGAWGACVNGNILTVQGDIWDVQQPGLQTPYFKDFISWLDDDAKVHPCNIAISYHGYEILEALCASALDNKPVYLPVNVDEMPDVIERMKAELI